MKVWLVFRDGMGHTELDSVWEDEEDAARHAEDLCLKKGIETLIEPYEVRQYDGGEA